MRKTDHSRDRELRRQLRQFDEVWRRVSTARSPREAAQAKGVRLMPRSCCRRRWR